MAKQSWVPAGQGLKRFDALHFCSAGAFEFIDGQDEKIFISKSFFLWFFSSIKSFFHKRTRDRSHESPSGLENVSVLQSQWSFSLR